MDLMMMWKQARGEVALPEPAGRVFHDGDESEHSWVSCTEAYTADQMRAIATPDPETLRRFAEMVAEECAKEVGRLNCAHGCGVGVEIAAAIRRHVKGEGGGEVMSDNTERAELVTVREALEGCLQQLRHLAVALRAVPSSEIAKCIAKADAALAAHQKGGGE